jgi:HAD superfamily hydrolase (TIGR01490 family)
MKETIAVFDFDGTITKKDTLLEFIKFSRGKLRFYLCFLLFLPMIILMKIKLLSNQKVKQLVFTYLYKGESIETFNKWGTEFSLVINKMLLPKAVEALKLHKDNGNKIVIVSASIENWIKPWADKIGVDMVLATKIETDKKGLLTGRFLTKNCYGREKVSRLLKVFPNRDNYTLFAYGDSRGDKELIEFAEEGFYRRFN